MSVVGPDTRDAADGSAIHVLIVEGTPPDGNLVLVERALAERWSVVRHEVSLEAVAQNLTGDARRIFDLFQHTPEPLIHSWLFAQAVRSVVPDGGIVLVSDSGGFGGIISVTESTRPPEVRRRVWTASGSSLYLEAMLVARTIDHVELPDASIIDWEIAQYRHSAEVLATGSVAVEMISRLGVEAAIAPMSTDPRVADPPSAVRSVWVPGPVSRRNRTGDVLRGAASVPGLSVTVGATDEIDDVWEGTTWDALAGVRGILGQRLRRSDRPATQPDAIVIGDPLAAPDNDTVALVESGIAVLASRGSVAEALWGGVSTWETSDDLAHLLEGAAQVERSLERWDGPSFLTASVESRARSVSVGVPLFGASPFLDDCIESILAQTVKPHEVILLDDGSGSLEVDAALSRWEERGAGVIRVLRQPNRGVCVARNRMIAEMTGDAFVLVDQDDELHPSFIEATSRALRHNEGLTAVAVWTEFFGEYSAIEAKPPFDRRVAHRENPIVSTAGLVDMRVSDLGVAFVPDLAFLYCEDWNFWSQIIAAGGTMGLVPEPLVRHRVHRSSGGFQRTELAHRIGKARALEPFRGSSSAG
ncbi:MAG TPA: glycosyltransferase family A protein [Acidimicrobiia bacterium]|nr:glycosyltransferase family A protein [Acidimicrobiia bacterium]